nr:hypothetical protein [uncultured Roseateles sp.]
MTNKPLAVGEIHSSWIGWQCGIRASSASCLGSISQSSAQRPSRISFSDEKNTEDLPLMFPVADKPTDSRATGQKASIGAAGIELFNRNSPID